MGERTICSETTCCWNCGGELNTRLLTISEAAAFCSVSKNTIYQWMRSGLVEWVCNPGGMRRVYRDSLVGLGARAADADRDLKEGA